MKNNIYCFSERYLLMKVKDQVSLPLLFENEDISAYKLHDHLWLFEARKGATASIYVLEGRDKTLVIDSGHIISDLQSQVKKVSQKPQILALTHGHLDHSGSVNQYDTVYINKNDLDLIPNYKGKIINIEDGFTFDLGNIHIKVLSLDGHTPGSVGFLDLEDRWLFTGDAIGSTCVWMQVTPLPLESLKGALKNIEASKDKFDEIFVGHYRQMDAIADFTYVEKMDNLLSKILYSDDYTCEPFTDGPGQDQFKFKIDPVISTLNGVQIVFNKNRIHFI